MNDLSVEIRRSDSSSTEREERLCKKLWVAEVAKEKRKTEKRKVGMLGDGRAWYPILRSLGSLGEGKFGSIVNVRGEEGKLMAQCVNN